MSASGPDAIRVSTVVAVDPEAAFEIFTNDIDVWWRRDPRYRSVSDAALRFEPGPGGRLLAVDASGAEFETGAILAWEPGKRLAFEWRARNFAPGQVTEIEIHFEPHPQGTRLTLEHRGWQAIPDDAPVRHGMTGEAFHSFFGLWWADLLVSLRAHAARREEPRR